MQYNKVEICGVNTAALPLLSEQEKDDLLMLVKSGDNSAREKLINGNLRLVLSVIQRFTGRGENMDDLFQVGCIGLIKSIDNFDVTQNVRFSTYAVPMIIGEIRRYLRDNSAVRVSRSIKDMAYRAMQAKEALTLKLNRDPTVDEIAKFMYADRREVVIALESISPTVSIYEPLYDQSGDAVYVLDQLSTPDTDTDWLNEILLREVIEKLSPREKLILDLRFMGGKTQMEVSQEIGISQAQVSRIEKGAINKIRTKQ